MDEATALTPQPEQHSSGTGEGGKEVVTTETMTQAPSNTTVQKVIVAVHGIGDQYSYATIQSVVNQFCEFYGQPAAVRPGTAPDDPLISEIRVRVAGDVAFRQRSAHATVA